MIQSIIGLLLILLALTALALQRFYSSVPARELKRLAGRGDALAKVLYRPVAYGGSLRLLLWIVTTAGLASGLVFLSNGLVPLAAMGIAFLALFLSLVVLPSARLTVNTARFAAFFAPAISNILNYLEPVFGRLSHLAQNRRELGKHSGLYEKEDIVALFDQQREQADNRIEHAHLELARRALYFDETLASDIVTTRSDLRTVKEDDAIGPILLEELHKSGQDGFVVYDEKTESVVGTLRLQDSVKARQGGKVHEVMQTNLAYVHEDFTLRQVQEALARTGQHLAIVLNQFGEMVGVITLGDLTRQLFGEAEEPDVAYDDKASVAAYKPKTKEDIIDAGETESEPVAEESPKPEAPSSEATEVVE